MCACVRLCISVEPRQQNTQRDTKIACNVLFIIYD